MQLLWISNVFLSLRTVNPGPSVVRAFRCALNVACFRPKDRMDPSRVRVRSWESVPSTPLPYFWGKVGKLLI
jgi:hypothetical protein